MATLPILEWRMSFRRDRQTKIRVTDFIYSKFILYQYLLKLYLISCNLTRDAVNISQRHSIRHVNLHTIQRSTIRQMTRLQSPARQNTFGQSARYLPQLLSVVRFVCSICAFRQRKDEETRGRFPFRLDGA